MLLALSLQFLDAFGNKTPDWASHWLTPLWLLGIGALFGLIACALLWLLAALLSRIPFLGELQDHPQQRRIAVAMLTVVFLALFAWSLATGAKAQAVAAGPAPATSPAMVILPLLAAAILAAAAVVALVSRRTVASAWDTIRE